MQAQLVPLQGGEPIPLEKVVSLVGRNRRLCDIYLQRSGVSKLHCVIVKTEDSLWVRELGSTNGTRVNGQRVMEQQVFPGDILAFGRSEFRVQSARSDPSGEDSSVGPPRVVVLSGSDSASRQRANASDQPAKGVADAKRESPAPETGISDTEVLRVLSQPVESPSKPKPRSMPPDLQPTGERTLPPPIEGRRYVPTVDRKGSTVRRGQAEPGESFLGRLKHNPMAIAGGGAVVLLTWMILAFWQSSDTDQEVYDIYRAIWAELNDKRENNASPAEWKEFTERVKTQIDPIVKRLEKTAKTARPLKQELLYCGRDYLPIMLHDARTKPSESEKKFLDHMADAQAMLEKRKLR